MEDTDIPTITLGFGDYIIVDGSNEQGYYGLGFEGVERHPVGTPVKLRKDFNPFLFLAFKDVAAIERFQEQLEDLKEFCNETV